MRKILRVVVAAALGLCAAVVAVDATPAAAAVSDVLTVGSVGGPNVTVGDVLKAPLKAGTVAAFGNLATCASSTLGFTVTTNPPQGNTATGSVNAMVYSNCTSNSGMACQPTTATNLPYTIGINGAANAVTLNTYSVNVKVCTPIGTATCAYAGSSLTGTWSNADSSISFNFMLTKTSGPVVCPTMITVKQTYAPLQDSSVSGSPRVFAQ
jgi:hypothetical protein